MRITKEEVAEVVRVWCYAWHTCDVETLLAMEAEAFGFGFRTFAPRDHIAEGQTEQRERLERFFGRMDSYSLVPEDFETSVTGDVGMAWGTFRETWQDKGQPPEQALLDTRCRRCFSPINNGYTQPYGTSLVGQLP